MSIFLYKYSNLFLINKFLLRSLSVCLKHHFLYFLMFPQTCTFLKMKIHFFVSAGLHKSMSRLNTSQQNMARFSSSSQTVVVPSTTASMGARSITCITGSRATPSVLSTHYPPSYTPHGHYTSARVTVSSSGVPGVGGTSSPTKSMSSGSMSMDPNSCREVLTVNVNQINQDLIRQVSSVLSHHDIHNLLLPMTSAAASNNLQPTISNSNYSSHYMVIHILFINRRSNALFWMFLSLFLF